MTDETGTYEAMFRTWKIHPAMKPPAIKALIDDLLKASDHSPARDVEAAGTLTNLRNQVVHLQMVMRRAIEDIEDQDVGGACRMLRVALDRTGAE